MLPTHPVEDLDDESRPNLGELVEGDDPQPGEEVQHAGEDVDQLRHVGGGRRLPQRGGEGEAVTLRGPLDRPDGVGEELGRCADGLDARGEHPSLALPRPLGQQRSLAGSRDGLDDDEAERSVDALHQVGTTDRRHDVTYSTDGDHHTLLSADRPHRERDHPDERGSLLPRRRLRRSPVNQDPSRTSEPQPVGGDPSRPPHLPGPPTPVSPTGPTRDTRDAVRRAPAPVAVGAQPAGRVLPRSLTRTV